MCLPAHRTGTFVCRSKEISNWMFSQKIRENQVAIFRSEDDAVYNLLGNGFLQFEIFEKRGSAMTLLDNPCFAVFTVQNRMCDTLTSVANYIVDEQIRIPQRWVINLLRESSLYKKKKIKKFRNQNNWTSIFSNRVMRTLVGFFIRNFSVLTLGCSP